MKTFMINLGIVYLGGFVFYCAVVLWFNRPNLRRQLAVLHNVNDGNVAYSNGLNAKIRDMSDKLQQNAYTIKELTEANQACWFDAVEQGNVISMYDEAAGDSRRMINKLENQVAHHEVTIREYRKLLKDAQDAVCGAQDAIRKAEETIMFLKSEVEMAERQLERLS